MCRGPGLGYAKDGHCIQAELAHELSAYSARSGDPLFHVRGHGDGQERSAITRGLQFAACERVRCSKRQLDTRTMAFNSAVRSAQTPPAKLMFRKV